MARSLSFSLLANSRPRSRRVLPARSVALRSNSWMRRVCGMLARMQAMSLSSAGPAAARCGSAPAISNSAPAHHPVVRIVSTLPGSRAV